MTPIDWSDCDGVRVDEGLVIRKSSIEGERTVDGAGFFVVDRNITGGHQNVDESIGTWCCFFELVVVATFFVFILF